MKKQFDDAIPGYIANIFYTILWIWHRYLSPFSLPLFIEGGTTEKDSPRKVKMRDSLVLGFTLMAIVAFVANRDCNPLLHRLLVAMGVWRLLDIVAMVVSHAVFGGLTTKSWLFRARFPDLQRVMVLMLLNYVEVLFWFSCIYYWIGSSAYYGLSLVDKTASGLVTEKSAAFFVSLSTMTTVGYGTFSPVGIKALVAAAFQGMIVLVFIGQLMVVVISRLLAAIDPEKRNTAEKVNSPHEIVEGKARIICTITPFVAYVIVLILSWKVFDL